MASRTETPRRRSQVAVMIVAAACSACVDTDPRPGEGLPACAAQAPSEPPTDSVVLVTGSLREAGLTVCSAVAIAPRILLTNSLCLVMPPILNPSDLDRDLVRPEFSGMDWYTGDVDYRGSCEEGGDWKPREDGSFSARIGSPLDPAAVSVLRIQGESMTMLPIKDVLLPHAESRCWDIIAVVILEEPLDLPTRPVRLYETTHVGELVSLTAYGPSFTEPLDRPATIEAVTFEAADFNTPPRSLRLSEQVCYYEPGGAVISQETGAVVGIIGFGTGDICGDPEGGTIASRVAPFRRLLLDAAEETGDVLRVEVVPTSPQTLEPCGS